MAFIKVGIHENLVLTDDSKINDKGTLELGVKADAGADAIMAAFESGETFSEMKSSFRFYPPSMKNFDQELKTADVLASELLVMRHQFQEYGRLFATQDEIDVTFGKLCMFEGLGITPDQYGGAIKQLTQEDFLKKVVTNLGTKFLQFLTSNGAFDGTVTFRQKFLRQSKAKNYAVISKSSFDVWVESMDVPKEASKIEFSEYEKKGGYDNPNPVASDSAQQGSAEDANKASSLFAAPIITGEDQAKADAAKTAPVESKAPDLFKTQPVEAIEVVAAKVIAPDTLPS